MRQTLTRLGLLLGATVVPAGAQTDPTGGTQAMAQMSRPDESRQLRRA